MCNYLLHGIITINGPVLEENLTYNFIEYSGSVSKLLTLPARRTPLPDNPPPRTIWPLPSVPMEGCPHAHL